MLRSCSFGIAVLWYLFAFCAVCTVSDGYRKNTGLGLFYSSWICRIAVALTGYFTHQVLNYRW